MVLKIRDIFGMAAGALIGLGTAGNAIAEEEKTQSVLTVSGEADMRVAPDLAIVSFGVVAQSAQAAEAMEKVGATQTVVIDALLGAGIEKTDIQTSSLSLQPQIESQDRETGIPTETVYRAENELTIRIHEIGKTGVVMQTALEAGANSFGGLRFSLEDSQAAEDAARQAAVADARQKAEILATAADMKLGAVLSINEGKSALSGDHEIRMARDSYLSSKAMPVQSGEVEVSASVTIRYALEPVE